MTTEQQKIGALIRAKRKENHLTQAELAQELNLTRDAIFAYEKGKVKVIPFNKRLELSTLLDIPFVELCYSNELYYEIFNNATTVAHTKAIKTDMAYMQKAEESAQPIKSDDEVDALAQIIHDEINKSFSKESIKDYIYAALEKRLEQTSTAPDTKK